MNEKEYLDFCEQLLEEVEKNIVETGLTIMDVALAATTKTNDPHAQSIVAKYKDEKHVFPAVYLTPLYHEYMNSNVSMNELAVRILRTFENNTDIKPNIEESFMRPEYAQEHLYLQVISKVNNEALLERCSHLDITGTNLTAIPRWSIQDDTIGNASVLVSRELQSTLLKMTDEELLKTAKEATLETTTYTIQSMSESMREMMYRSDMPKEMVDALTPIEREPEYLYVISNKQKAFGASALLSKQILEETHKKLAEAFYIIPSSLHEVLAVPKSYVRDPLELQMLCQEVNASHVSVEEQLGDDILYCDGKSLHVCNTLNDLHMIEDLHETNTASYGKGIRM